MQFDLTEMDKIMYVVNKKILAHKDGHSVQQMKLVKRLQGHSSENNILSSLKCKHQQTKA